MIKKWKRNPKLIGSGIVECIPQTGRCPNNCKDCFFQSGRSYLEPLEKNLPHIPSPEMAKGRVVRFNDGNDSNNQRELVEDTAQIFKDYFFNTAIPYRLEDFSGPVVLTINPRDMTDKNFYKFTLPVPKNLMFLRIRVNTWNLETVVKPAIEYYTANDKYKVVIVLTFMAYMNYYNESAPENHKEYYEWKKRTTNPYWCIKQEKINEIMNLFNDNPYVYSCGIKEQHSCKFCGNCLREYYNTKERCR